MIRETPEGVGRPEFQVPPADAASEPQDPGPQRESGPSAPASSELELLAGEAERLVRDGIEQAERRIRRHPIACVGIAAGVGLLLGVLLGRDR